MRLDEIRRKKAELCSAIPDLVNDEDVSDLVEWKFEVRLKEARRRWLARMIGPTLLNIDERAARRSTEDRFPRSWRVCKGERFADDVSAASLLRHLGKDQPAAVLVVGCFTANEDVQFWLRRGVRQLEGIDVLNLTRAWDRIVPELRRAYGCDVRFTRAPVEQMPFADETFDLVSSTAVLEHVQNLRAMCAETARVLKPGAFAWHKFGPLYYSFGGDHCISDYGVHAGYDHLLSSESEYRRRIDDQSFYEKQSDPNSPFWARRDQFSFAKVYEYVEELERHFDFRSVVIKLSVEGIDFKRKHNKSWNSLLDAGLTECDLLTKGMSVVLQKRQ